MAEVKFIPEIIETMAKGKVNRCPVCGKGKAADAWVCKDCFAAKGFGLVGEVQTAVKQVVFRKERLEAAAVFLRQYLASGGRFNSRPTFLATNAMSDTGENRFSHGLLTVAADMAIIPEEFEKARQTSERAVEERERAAQSVTLNKRARFVASRQTRQKARQRRKGFLEAVPA